MIDDLGIRRLLVQDITLPGCPRVAHYRAFIAGAPYEFALLIGPATTLERADEVARKAFQRTLNVLSRPRACARVAA